MPRALEGIRVVDFGQYVAGPLLAVMLADEGADVVRIDPPGGPRWKHPANAVLQRGKKSLLLDLKQDSDWIIAEQLVLRADIVVENFRPGVMNRLRLGPDEMLAANDRLIYCSLPGFGSDDPRALLPGWEGIVGAATGLYSAGHRDPPGTAVFTALSVASNYAAFIGANCVIAALIARERTGRGQLVEVPLFDAMFEAIGSTGQTVPGTWFNPIHAAASGDFQCADGRWVHVVLIAPRHLRWFVESFGRPEWVDEGMADARTLLAQPALATELRRHFVELFRSRTAAEWDRAVNAIGVPIAVCQCSREWLQEDSQARAMRAVIELNDPELGPTIQAGYPLALSLTPPAADGPRHQLDADRASVLAQLSNVGEPAAPAAAPGANRPSLLEGALAGIRVVDLTQVWAGPSAGRILAELGADVVKINKPDGWVIGVGHVNSGKRSMLVDLGNAAGRDVLWKLVQNADVFMQNYARGTAERLGLGEAAVRRRRPDIIYASISAYSYDGPRGAFRGWEPLGQTPTGMTWRQGGGTPRTARFPLCDFGSGHLFALAILLGLFHRARSGLAQAVQSSLVQAGTYHQIPYMLSYDGREWNEPGGPRANGWGPLDRLYRANDGWFYLAAPRADATVLACVAGLNGVESLAICVLAQELEHRFATASADTWVERLRGAGVAAQRLLTVEEVMEDPLAKSRGLSVVRTHPGIGAMRMVGIGPRLTRTPARLTFPAAAMGWHTRAILAELGCSLAEVDALVAGHVVADHLTEEAFVAL
jgi:crotonobetainyl-CoA:carnitine CoA-transferase CaiB-like acyl-CoA transferase